MAIAVEVSRQDMDSFLTAQGFVEMQVAGVKERVYGKVVSQMVTGPLCLRVYTSIEGESSRPLGEDAIRTVLVTRVDGAVKVIGADRRVHRVEGWRENLQKRLDTWSEQLGPKCPKCGAVTVRKQSRRGPFWGCCKYPVCRTVQPIQTPLPVRLQGGKPRFEPAVKREVPPPFQDEHDERLAGMREHVEMKDMYARYEAAQERAAYMAEMEEELQRLGAVESDDSPPANW